jgi:hypothetical protein
MTSPPPPIACTLGAAVLGNREDEFRALFARALRRLERRDAHGARLVLDADVETQARDLFAREKQCCAFFDFAMTSADGALVVDARVPEGADQALDFLLALAPPSMTFEA